MQEFSILISFIAHSKFLHLFFNFSQHLLHQGMWYFGRNGRIFCYNNKKGKFHLKNFFSSSFDFSSYSIRMGTNGHRHLTKAPMGHEVYLNGTHFRPLIPTDNDDPGLATMILDRQRSFGAGTRSAPTV